MQEYKIEIGTDRGAIDQSKHMQNIVNLLQSLAIDEAFRRNSFGSADGSIENDLQAASAGIASINPAVEHFETLIQRLSSPPRQEHVDLNEKTMAYIGPLRKVLTDLQSKIVRYH